ncbi:DNA-directed RNA polymerase subunit omega [Chengkuizengella axinellae]|uniref:DNA-directed RNA polymerase subunit omega n=1 Tax=Chengkuizengella axinellae TaxID=3064388 RepID=A0ABT9IVH3_9BACL|nr:DNA-directed RNA polymerase subunit omega [Chengkuizengella sp. 2205SS18-9]MDP5273361.1 DNA-directed RNA polymerase subunit omega [Chengkuizengella sp. 2205SS18-9]
MLYPSIDEIVDRIDSKYSLVVAVSKEARLLRDGKSVKLEKVKSHKYVGMALEEIYNEHLLIIESK